MSANAFGSFLTMLGLETLALHMASTIYSDFDKESRECNVVADGLIRVSIGLEDPDLKAEDFMQAFKM